MEINDAWNQFVKTGSVENYIKYKNLCAMENCIKKEENKLSADIN